MVGSGSLFENESHRVFMTLTASRYNAMDDRMERKKLPPLPFSLAAFRAHALAALNNHEDGFIQCRFCHGFFTFKEVSADHEIPLSRGGSAGLQNLGFPCRKCNAAKGSMTPGEFLQLLEFLEKYIPLARKDVLSRLAMSVQLAAGARSQAAVVNELKKSGEWKKVQKARLAKKKGQAPPDDF